MTELEPNLTELYESWLYRMDGTGQVLVDIDQIPEAGRDAMNNYMDARSNRGVDSPQAEFFRQAFLTATGIDPKPFMSYFVAARKTSGA